MHICQPGQKCNTVKQEWRLSFELPTSLPSMVIMMLCCLAGAPVETRPTRLCDTPSASCFLMICTMPVYLSACRKRQLLEETL